MTEEKIPTHGIVYTCENIEHGIRYIGSTIQPLSQRICNHKKSFKSWCEGKANIVCIYQYFKDYGFDTFEWKALEMIDNVDELPRENFKKLLFEVEGKYIRNTQCVNYRIAGRTPKQYRDEHKHEMKEYFKKRYEQNKGQVLQYGKKRYEQNKEKVKERVRQYYQRNKDKINDRLKRDRIPCPACGKELRRSSLRGHVCLKHNKE